MNDLSSLLGKVGNVTRMAGEHAQEVRRRLQHEFKEDGSVVTNGDREVEKFLRTQLEALVPGSTVWGEEFGRASQEGQSLWIVDPIDGTSNYSYGSPLWGVSVGLVQDGEIVLGAISLPDLKELYQGARGMGATCNSERLARLKPGPVERHELVGFNDHVYEAITSKFLVGKMRLAGAVVVDGAFVAQHRYRGMIGMRERLYDIAALLAILRELDADIRYADGAPLDMELLLKGGKIDRPWIAFPPESGFYGRPV